MGMQIATPGVDSWVVQTVGCWVLQFSESPPWILFCSVAFSCAMVFLFKKSFLLSSSVFFFISFFLK